MRKLVDVSSYNGTVDWKKAKQYGVDGAILKIIRKDLKCDNGFNRNYQACNENHINWCVQLYICYYPEKGKGRYGTCLRYS